MLQPCVKSRALALLCRACGSVVATRCSGEAVLSRVSRRPSRPHCVVGTVAGGCSTIVGLFPVLLRGVWASCAQATCRLVASTDVRG